MLEQALLREQFQALLEQQRHAVRVYADLAGNANDPSVKQEAQQIQRDKERHILLTERLLEIVD